MLPEVKKNLYIYNLIEYFHYFSYSSMAFLNFLNSSVLLSFAQLVEPNQNVTESFSFRLYKEFSANIRLLEDSQNLIDYQRVITTIADSGKGDVVFNDGKEYAAILFNSIFSRVEESICIYASQLRDDLTMLEPYCLPLLQCINNNISVRILLEPEQADNHSQLRAFLQRYSEEHTNLEIKCVANANLLMRQQISDDAHFTIADGKMYRLEYDITNFKATASFNCPKVVTHLQEAFDTIWNFTN